MGDNWAGLLDPGEDVIWQGQPDAQIDWSGLSPLKMGVGLIFCMVGLNLVRDASSFGIEGMGDGLFAVIPVLMGLSFAGIGARAAFGEPLLDAMRRSNSWYTLTDRRVIVASKLFGRKQLQDMRLSPETDLVLEEGSPGSVRIPSNPDLSFRRIEEARMVYGLMRKVQETAHDR